MVTYSSCVVYSVLSLSGLLVPMCSIGPVGVVFRCICLLGSVQVANVFTHRHAPYLHRAPWVQLHPHLFVCCHNFIIFSSTFTKCYDFSMKYQAIAVQSVASLYEQINKQQSLPFSLYIVRVISPILSEKKKVETLRSLHCGCFYTHTHKETNMCRECYFVLWRFEPSQPQRIYIRAGNKNQCISHFCSAQQSSNRKILFKNPHILSRHKYKTKQVCTQTSNINF